MKQTKEGKEFDIKELYSKDGEICKFKYPIDVRQAIESGNFFKEDPRIELKKREEEAKAEAYKIVAEVEAKERAKAELIKEAKENVKAEIAKEMKAEREEEEKKEMEEKIEKLESEKEMEQNTEELESKKEEELEELKGQELKGQELKGQDEVIEIKPIIRKRKTKKDKKEENN